MDGTRRACGRRAARIAAGGLAALLVAAAPPGPATAQDAPPALAPEAGRIELAPVEAVGARAARDGYAAPTASGATRTETPLRDLPQSVTVVPRAVLDDLNATRVEDGLAYAGGVARLNNFGGVNFFEYAVRGFASAEFYRNGFPASRGYQGVPDASNIEALEVLRGPAAVLYGRGDPGGTLNILTRQPRADPAFATGFQAGAFGLLRGTLDATGPVAPGSSVLYRVTAATEKADSFREFVATSRDALAPVVRWGLGPDTHVTLEGDFLRSDQTFDRGVVAVRGRLGAVPLHRYLGEPGSDGRVRIEGAGGQLRLEHRVTRDWNLRVGADYRVGSLEGFSTEASRLLADDRTLLRERRFREYDWTVLVGRAEATGRLRTGAVEHVVLAGLEGERYGDKEVQLRSNPVTSPYAIDILAPRYGLAPLPALTRRTDFDAQVRSLAVFAQDQVTLSPTLKALVGLRVDTYRQEVTQRTSGAVAAQDRTAVLPRAGLVWQPVPPLSLYANAARSFRPNGGVTAAGGAFAPEEGTAYDVGARWETAGGLAATFGLFHIARENVLTPDPANAGFNVAAGAARSRGFDVNLAGDLTPSWRLIGGYAFVDAAITRDNALAPGTRLINVPRHAASLLGVHAWREGRLAGVAAGGGVTYVGERNGDAAGSGFRLPGHVTLDALATWDPTPNLRLGLNVYNLLDAETYDRAISSVWVAPGRPRTVVGSLSLRF